MSSGARQKIKITALKENMGRPCGTKNRPGHDAGGSRKGSGRKLKPQEKHGNPSVLLNFLRIANPDLVDPSAASVETPVESTPISAEVTNEVQTTELSLNGSDPVGIVRNEPITICDPIADNDGNNVESDSKVEERYSKAKEKSTIAKYLTKVREKVMNRIRDKDSPYEKSMWIEPQDFLVGHNQSDPKYLYYPKVFLWLPKFLGATIKCTSCGSQNLHVQETLTRRIYGLEYCYYILYRRYECVNVKCKKSLRTTDKEVLESLPDHLKLKFPAYLTYHAGVDKSMLSMMRNCFTNGMGCHQFRNSLMAMHMLYYHNRMLEYLSVQSDRIVNGIISKDKVKQFSEFDDRSGYDGHIPSENYLRDVYIGFTESHMDQLDLEVMKISGNVLKGDHSFKLPKRLTLLNGESIFDGLYSITNELGEIRGQYLTCSKSHEQIRGPLENMRKGLTKMGFNQPKVFFTDDAGQDASFLESVFPSLLEGVNQESKSKLPNCELPENHEILVISDRESANLQLNELLESNDENIPVGLDCEWDFNRLSYQSGKVATIQISTERKTLILQVSRMNRLPSALIDLIYSPRVLKIGRNVGGDISKIIRDYNLRSNGSNERPGLIELGVLCRKMGVIEDGRSSLADIVARVLKLHLSKDTTIRESPWSNQKLTDDQIKYAALDSYISLMVYRKLTELTSPQKVGARLESEDLVPGLIVRYTNGNKLIALGKVVELDEDLKKRFEVKIWKTKSVIELLAIYCPASKVRIPEDPLKTKLSDYKKGDLICVPVSDLKLSHFNDIQEVVVEEEPIEQGGEKKSRVLQDVWHLMDRVMRCVLKKHGLAKEFSRSFRDALFVFNQEDVKRVKKYLNEIGEDYEEYLKYNYDWLVKRIRRHIPPPQELLSRVQSVFDFYQDAVDDALGIPLFNAAAKKEAKSVLQAIRDGFVSDLDDVSMYSFVKYDNALSIYRCVRGTNSSESMHSNIMSHFSAFNCSPRFAVCLLADFRHRFNMHIGRLHRPGTVNFGHYDVWIINRLHSLSREVYENPKWHLFPQWVNSDFLEHTGERFGIVPIPSEIKKRLEIADNENNNFWVTKNLETKHPILPVHTPEEKKLFKKILVDEGRFNSTEMAIKFNKKADGKVIFYKLPEYLERYKRKTFDKNENAKNSLRLIQNDHKALSKELLKPRAPILRTENTSLRQLEVVSISKPIQGQTPTPYVALTRPKPFTPIVPYGKINLNSTFTNYTSASVSSEASIAIPVKKARKRKRCLQCTDETCNGGIKRSLCSKFKQ